MNCNDKLACDICFDDFINELGKKPRILSCGHTFCECCIQKFIKNKSPCPNCVRPILLTRIEDTPINFLALSLIDSEPQEDSQDDEDLESDGQCSKHSIPNHFYCRSCNIMICGICIGLKHKKCRFLKFQDALLQMKTRKLDIIGENIRKKKEQVVIMERKITSLRVQLEKEENMKTMSNRIINQMQEIREAISSLKSIDEIKRIEERNQIFFSDLNHVRIDEIPTTEIFDYLKKNAKFCRINCKDYFEIVSNFLYHTTFLVNNRILFQNRTVLYNPKKQHDFLFAPLVFEENLLKIKCFSENRTPNGSYIDVKCF